MRDLISRSNTRESYRKSNVSWQDFSLILNDKELDLLAEIWTELFCVHDTLKALSTANVHVYE